MQEGCSLLLTTDSMKERDVVGNRGVLYLKERSQYLHYGEGKYFSRPNEYSFIFICLI